MKTVIGIVVILIFVTITHHAFSQPASQVQDIGGAIFRQDCYSARHNYSSYTYFKVIQKNKEQPEFKLLSYKWVGSEWEREVPHSTTDDFYKRLIIENKLHKREYPIEWPSNPNYKSEFKDYGMKSFKESIYNFYLNYYLIIFLNKIIFQDNQFDRELVNSIKFIIKRTESALNNLPKYNISESGKFYPYDFSYCYRERFNAIKKDIAGIRSKVYGIPESKLVDHVALIPVENPSISDVNDLYSGIYISPYGVSLLNMKLNLKNNAGSASLSFEYIFKDGVKKNFAYELHGTKDRNTNKVSMKTNPMSLDESYRRLSMYNLSFELKSRDFIEGRLGDGTIFLKKSKVPLKLPKKAPFWTGKLVDSKPNGEGVLFTIDRSTEKGETYQTASIGTFLEGNLMGEGRYYQNKSGTTCYEGVFFNNKLTGPGRIIYPLSCPNYQEVVSYYTGDFTDGTVQGKVYGINCEGEVSQDCNVTYGKWDCQHLIKDHRTRFLENLTAAGSLLIAEVGVIFNIMSSTGSSYTTMTIDDKTSRLWAVEGLTEKETYFDNLRKFYFSIHGKQSGKKHEMYAYSNYRTSNNNDPNYIINTYRLGSSSKNAVFSISYYPNSKACYCHGFRAEGVTSMEDAINKCSLKFMELNPDGVTN